MPYINMPWVNLIYKYMGILKVSGCVDILCLEQEEKGSLDGCSRERLSLLDAIHLNREERTTTGSVLSG